MFTFHRNREVFWRWSKLVLKNLHVTSWLQLPCSRATCVLNTTTPTSGFLWSFQQRQEQRGARVKHAIIFIFCFFFLFIHATTTSAPPQSCFLSRTFYERSCRPSVQKIPWDRMVCDLKRPLKHATRCRQGWISGPKCTISAQTSST